MARRLVVCCDGTWNVPRNNTNVFRTYDFLRQQLGAPPEQHRGDGVRTCSGLAKDGGEVVLFYDRGVGTNWFERVRGGGLGVGLSENVRDAYYFLAHHFRPGSEIYVFGFSRGAYTARSLCGFIEAAGLLREPSESDVWRAYLDYYATEDRIVARPEGWSLADVGKWLRKQVGDWVGADLRDFPRHEDVKLRFIGAYDTVGALGIPLSHAVKVNEAIVGFHHTGISALIEHAVHALAVDEKRGPYTPTLWTLPPGQSLEAEQTVLQVWFPGVHSDIGGGYLEKGIGDITFDFMMGQAAGHGMVIDPEQPYPTMDLKPLPPQHESMTDAWRRLSEDLKLVASTERSIGLSAQDANGQTVPVAGDVRLHPALVGRLGQHVTIILDEDEGKQVEQEYRPPNITATTLPTFQ